MSAPEISAVGEFSLDFDAMELPAHPGLTLTAYSAEAGTPDHDALRLLVAWAATEREQTRDAGPARP
ncbi:hypothetical protein ACGFZL_11425 [Streptomyces sp. NPDC048182]|uniref:MmyB family transcriptional regulator n=1 Tax=Streptomyces sp. NPDC048182 TaxID=3365507 RepID=UPI00371DC507